MNARTAQMAVTSRGIRIGIATVPRQHIETTTDAELIQAALLAKRVNEAGHRALNWVLGFCGLFLAIGFYQGWI